MPADEAERTMKPCHVLPLVVLVLPLLLACVAATDSWTNCPAACRCRWVSGRKMAECTAAGLTAVPANLSPEIQVLDVSRNPLASLPANAFRHAALYNLQKAYLRHCNITHVHERAFASLEILIELDLSWNSIRRLHPHTFRDNVRLRVLNAAHNPLERLDDGLFNGLAYLQLVDVSDCRVSHVGTRAFADVPNLLQLLLERNNLTTLKLAALEHVHSLGSLVLHGNPWHCDCHLQPFLAWTLLQNLYTRPTACEQPERLRGRMWSELGPRDLACLPEVSVADPVVETSGPNVTLPCRATGSPVPEVQWLFNSRALTNNTRRSHGRRKYSMAETADDAARWLNLTVVGVSAYDVGNYTCVARSPGGSASLNVTLRVRGVLVGVEGSTMRDAGRPARAWVLVLGLGTVAALLAAAAAVLLLRPHRRRRRGAKPAEPPPGRRQRIGSACEEKLLLTTVNPVQKPPRLVTSVAVERSEVTLNLLDNGAAYQACSSSEDQRLRDREDEGRGGPYPPDLLPFPPHDADSSGGASEESPLIARKKRVVSWCEGTSSAFDNLGPRTTVDGSSALALDKRVADEEEEEEGLRALRLGRPPPAEEGDRRVAVVLAARRARLAHRNSWSAADTPQLAAAARWPLPATTTARAAYLLSREFVPHSAAADAKPRRSANT